MRKQKLKNYLKFGILLFGVSILFVNCERDYDEVFELENNSEIIVKILNQKQVESNEEIVSKLQQINTELNTESTLILAKGIYNKDYDFTINTDYVKYIEKGDYHSYNFFITRKNPNDKRVENLLLSLNNQGGYNAFIIKYDFSKEEYKNSNGTKLKKGTTEYIPIDFDTSNFSDGVFAKSTLRFICEEKWVYIPCTIIYGNHEDGLCNDHWALESTDCSWVDTGGKDYDYVDSGGTNDGTSDNCDTCGANGGTNADGSETTIISVPIMFSLEYTQFYNTLNFQQKKWCDDNYYLIDGFLLQNLYSEQAENFVILAIDFLLVNTQFNFTQYENWFSTDYPDLEPNTLEINPDDITYDFPLTQQVLPTFDTYISYFPKLGNVGNYKQMTSPGVYELVGGSLYTSYLNNPSYSNACSIRGSRGLLYSGINIPVLRYNNSQRTQKGGDNKNYILDAVSFNKFMIDKFGEATHKLEGTDANNAIKVANLLNGKNGIYVIINNSHTQANYSGHVDAIINGICIGGAYTLPTGGIKSIRIWELN